MADAGSAWSSSVVLSAAELAPSSDASRQGGPVIGVAALRIAQAAALQGWVAAARSRSTSVNREAPPLSVFETTLGDHADGNFKHDLPSAPTTGLWWSS
ncbi:MAG: hypothetical protein ACKPKO_22205, partial [Candidatus Fonsibacter sp.]